MNNKKKEYRRKKIANKIAKQQKVSVSSGYRIADAYEKILTALGPLKNHQKVRVIKASAILLGLEF